VRIELVFVLRCPEILPAKLFSMSDAWRSEAGNLNAWNDLNVLNCPVFIIQPCTQRSTSIS